MELATIGDDVDPLYEFTWDNGRTRTTDEIGDLEEAGLNADMDDIVEVARDDDECEVRIIGFQNP